MGIKIWYLMDMAVEMPKPPGASSKEARTAVYLDGTAIYVIDKKVSKPITSVKTIIAPGWSEGKDSKGIIQLMDVLAQAGRDSRSFSHPRHGIQATQNGFPLAEERKALTLHAVIEDALSTDPKTGKKTGKVDIVAQSEGGIYSVIAALKHPERIRNILLVNPGGITQPRNELHLANNFMRDAARETIKGAIDLFVLKDMNKKNEALSMLDGGLKTASYIFGNPARSLEEIRAIAKSSTLDVLEQLKEHGIGLYGISGINDHIFSADEMQKNISKKYRQLRQKDPNKIGDPTILFDGFYTVKGGHFGWYIDSAPRKANESNRNLRAIPAILTAAEDKYNKRKETTK